VRGRGVFRFNLPQVGYKPANAPLAQALKGFQSQLGACENPTAVSFRKPGETLPALSALAA